MLIYFLSTRCTRLQISRGILFKRHSLWGYDGKITVNIRLDQVKILVMREVSSSERFFGKNFLVWNLHLTNGIGNNERGSLQCDCFRSGGTKNINRLNTFTCYVVSNKTVYGTSIKRGCNIYFPCTVRIQDLGDYGPPKHPIL